MHNIASGVFSFSRLSIFQYILIDHRKITLIDTGLALFSRTLYRTIIKKFPDHSIERILITHADGDHYGGVNEFLSRNPLIKVAAGLGEAAAMENGQMSRELQPADPFVTMAIRVFSPFFKAKPVIAGEILRPGQILPILGGLSVIDSAGHTPQHLSFYLPTQRILFAGDSVVDRGGIPSPAYGYNCWDSSKAVKSFERQMALEAKFICSDHSIFNLSS